MYIQTKFRYSTKWFIPKVNSKNAPILFAYFIAILPFGSVVTLVGSIAFFFLYIFFTKVSYLPVKYWFGVLIGLGFLSGFYSLLIGQKIGLYLFYASYLSILLGWYLILKKRISCLNQIQLEHLCILLLGLDLALNIPAVLVEIGMHGIGDWVTGFPGVLLQSTLSQNRTNALRAGIMCFMSSFIYFNTPLKSWIVLLSIAFNGLVIIFAMSMTTTISFAGAFIFSSFFNATLKKKLFAISGCISFAFIGDFVNRVTYQTTGVIDFALSFSTRWIPKLDAYLYFFSNLCFQYPWVLFFGFGPGNYMNRFVILTNYQKYSDFPLKSLFEKIFANNLVCENLIDRYHLENGVLGNSILGTPWSGNLSLLSEWGIFGLIILWLLCGNIIKKIWKLPSVSIIGSGKFFMAFVFLNSFFDCYQDYPETVIPIFISVLIVLKYQKLKPDLRPV